MEVAIIDTGVWYALFDNKDPHYKEAAQFVEYLDMLDILFPWPTAYETLRSKFVKNSLALNQFEIFIKKRNIIFFEDNEIQQLALNLAFESSLRLSRPLSMIDCLIRLMIEDSNIKINYLATFNRRDFIDVCSCNGVEFL